MKVRVIQQFKLSQPPPGVPLGLIGVGRVLDIPADSVEALGAAVEAVEAAEAAEDDPEPAPKARKTKGQE